MPTRSPTVSRSFFSPGSIRPSAKATTAILTGSETPYDAQCDFKLSGPVEVALPAVAEQDASSFTVSPLFDLRVRQEIMDGVYYFAPEPDRNWYRFRTRLGAEASGGNHEFKVLLTNEHRRSVGPGRPRYGEPFTSV